eukprot:jgi/Antlo1/468/2255
MEYSHYETRDIVAVSLYAPQKEREGMPIFLIDGRMLVVGETEISLFRRVRCICSVHVDKYKTEVVLEKEQRGLWRCLNGSRRDCGTYLPPKIDLTKDVQEPAKYQTLEALLQHIYESGSDDVRRAMNRSFLESRGTALCTRDSAA